MPAPSSGVRYHNDQDRETSKAVDQQIAVFVVYCWLRATATGVTIAVQNTSHLVATTTFSGDNHAGISSKQSPMQTGQLKHSCRHKRFAWVLLDTREAGSEHLRFSDTVGHIFFRFSVLCKDVE